MGKSLAGRSGGSSPSAQTCGQWSCEVTLVFRCCCDQGPRVLWTHRVHSSSVSTAVLGQVRESAARGPLSGEVPEVSSGSWQRTPFLSPHLRVWGGGPLPGPGSWLPPSIFRSRDAAALPCDFLPRCPLPGPVTALTPRDLGLALGRPG